MKKLFLIIIALGALSLNSFAQVKRNVDSSQTRITSQEHHRKSIQGLDLTKEQKIQMKEMNQNAKQQRESIKNNTALTQEQKMEQLKELKKNQKEKMSSILTPEQKQKFEKMKEKRKDGKDGKKGDMKKGDQFKKLNLSQTQKDQMKTLREDGKKQKDAIKNDASLTQDQKTQKLKELMSSQKTKMQSILTPEQKSQIKQHGMHSNKNGKKMNRKDERVERK